MSIPNNIKKEHILKALLMIDKEGIPNYGESDLYDVLYDGKRYPPKLVISKANFFANGKELDRSKFSGGQNSLCHKLLIENNFNIVEKFETSYNEPNIWFVTQGKTYTKDIGMKFLWAPIKGKDNKSRFYWDNLLKIKKGDFIFNYSEGLKGISIALSDGYKATNNYKNSQWNQDGYKVDIDLIHLNPPISANQLSSNKVEIASNLLQVSKKPFNINGAVNQGYLFEFTKEAGKYLRNIYGKKFGNEVIDDFFDNVEDTKMNNINNSNLKFNPKNFITNIEVSGLFYSDHLVNRLISSIITKPFVILTGLSGSGKTKLAQAFVKWICLDENQYRIVPIGSDWTNREPLLGYPNALELNKYVKPDSGVLDLIIQAINQPDLPHFLILDEMNLSHVERYFADFLSVMESNEEIPLHSCEIENGVPQKLKVPSNLFIIGTVNIDETTNMFSPKVLDRANTIEFRVTKDEMKNFLGNIKAINMDALTGKGAGMAKSFLGMARNKEFATEDIEAINNALIQFFGELKKTGAEFGYRTATEILRLIHQLTVLDSDLTTNQKIDIAIMQKLLPKLHGSRRKLSPVLETLGSFCVTKNLNVIKDVFGKDDFDFEKHPDVHYRLSLEKIARMHKGAIDNGFASFAEA
jgi:5-methylcytosine-specific restriction enzyme B